MPRSRKGEKILRLEGETRKKSRREKVECTTESSSLPATDASLRHPTGMKVNGTAYSLLVGKGQGELIQF